MGRLTGHGLLIALLLALAGCGGGSSFTPSPPPPSSTPPPPSSALSINSISPTSAVAGSPDLTLTITGSNFDGDGVIRSRVVWSVNGILTPLAMTFVNSNQLTALIPAALLSNPVTAKVLVQNWDHIEGVGSAISNSVSFSVTSAAAAAVSPTLVTLGPKQTLQFVANLNGNSAEATWDIEEGAAGGNITSAGLYTVPAYAGTFHVIATFVADPSKNAAATVTVAASGFTATGSMAIPRSGHSATLLADGRVLITGGGEASAELFDPARGTFTPTGSMTTARYGATATLLANGKVLVTGGFGPGTSSLTRLNSAERYDPLSGTFSATGSMTDARVLHTATLLSDGRVLIAGGTRDGGGGGAALASAELYDPTTGTFAFTGGMLTDRAEHTATLLASGEVLIAGGWNGHAADAADDPPWDPLVAELFDPSFGSFKASGSMSTTRTGHSAIRLADGKVLVFGGVLSLQNLHDQPPDPHYAELYDPAAGTFAALGNVTVSRHGYTATLLNSGKVLLAGGEILGSIVSTAELLDPVSGSLTVTGQVVTGRKGHTATRLNDGRVLVTGGTDSNGNALATAELYE